MHLLFQLILHHLLHLKQLKLGQNNQKQQHTYLIFYSMISLINLFMKRNMKILLNLSNRNFVWLVKLVLPIAWTELLSFIFELYCHFFLKSYRENKFVKSVNSLPSSIKSINPMQKYPHITESFASTRKMLAIMFLLPTNPLISSRACSKPKL